MSCVCCCCCCWWWMDGYFNFNPKQKRERETWTRLMMMMKKMATIIIVHYKKKKWWLFTYFVFFSFDKNWAPKLEWPKLHLPIDCFVSFPFTCHHFTFFLNPIIWQIYNWNKFIFSMIFLVIIILWTNRFFFSLAGGSTVCFIWFEFLTLIMQWPTISFFLFLVMTMIMNLTSCQVFILQRQQQQQQGKDHDHSKWWSSSWTMVRKKKWERKIEWRKKMIISICISKIQLFFFCSVTSSH